jgi:hypothetical protein
MTDEELWVRCQDLSAPERRALIVNAWKFDLYTHNGAYGGLRAAGFVEILQGPTSMPQLDRLYRLTPEGERARSYLRTLSILEMYRF